MKYIQIITIIILLTGCKSQDERLAQTMHNSIAWMWHQQDEDGGWHSQTHAVLKDGKALTPYILYHLLLISDDTYQKPEGAVDRSIAFIRRELRSSMTIGDDSLITLNYPNYSAAYALKVLCLVHQDTALQHIIATHLMKEQFTEHRGIMPDNIAYGGWGYGEPDLPFGEYGHVDISHTRRIVEALIEEAKEEAKAEAEEKAEASVMLFLQGVQRSHEDSRLYEGCISRKDLPYDGGFVSSVATLATNKCEPVFIYGAGYHYPSYATATCDGLLAMHALGMENTEAYKDAVHWLTENQDMNTIDGLSPHDPEQWYQVMHYYHFAVRAEAMTAADISGTWSGDLMRLLIKEQQPDGYYINPLGGVNKEDDPLMATIFAVQAGYKLICL